MNIGNLVNNFHHDLKLRVLDHVHLLQGHFVYLVCFDRLLVHKITTLYHLFDFGVAVMRLCVVYALEKISVALYVCELALVIWLTY